MSKAAAVAYCTAGGLLVFSGIKGASISSTLQAALKGNLNVSGTETIAGTGTSSGGSGTGSTSNTASAGTASQNYIGVAEFLVSNGYSKAAAAGICGCIAGESSANPEAVGDQGTSFGVIQEHGSQYSGLVTGNPSADLGAQESAILAYNNAQGSGLVAMLNSFTDPVQAAYFYSEKFERPAVKDSDVVTSVATSVYAQLNAKG